MTKKIGVPRSKRPHRHVTLRKVRGTVGDSFILLGPNGNEICSFRLFVRAIQSLSTKTQIAYQYHVADAFDYFFEGAIHSARDQKSSGFTRSALKELVDSWFSYLVDGPNSSREIAASIATTLPSPLIRPKSAVTKLAALQHLLRVSDLAHREAESLSTLGTPFPALTDELLFPELLTHTSLDHFQKRKLIESSSLAGAIAGGPKRKKSSLARRVPPSVETIEARTFPMEKVALLIQQCSTYRDRALFSLYAASGCRQSEGLQLLIEDIDLRNRKVFLIPPESRKNYDDAYTGLSEADRKRLSWKARATTSTFLIEPFASMFFENLEKYFTQERLNDGRTNFIFQHLTKLYAGRPYFLSTDETRSQAFYRATRGLDIADTVDGLHSLRRMYATYLINYFPCDDGTFGLPPVDVQRWMGHSNIKETLKYAVKDQLVQEHRLSWGNDQMFEGARALNATELRLRALEYETQRLRALLQIQSPNPSNAQPNN